MTAEETFREETAGVADDWIEDFSEEIGDEEIRAEEIWDDRTPILVENSLAEDTADVTDDCIEDLCETPVEDCTGLTEDCTIDVTNDWTDDTGVRLAED